MLMKSVTVEIKAQEWLGYTGPMGGYHFKGGVSVDPIPLRNALRIGATIEAIDKATGQSLHPSSYKLNFSPGKVEAQSQTLPTEVSAPEVPAVEPETTQEETAQIDLAPERIVQENGTVRVIYSRAQLEAIADRSGIAGVREIGDPLGVKGRSVTELIEKVLETQ